MLHQTEITSGRTHMNHIETYVIRSGDRLTLKLMSYHLIKMRKYLLLYNLKKREIGV